MERGASTVGAGHRQCLNCLLYTSSSVALAIQEVTREKKRLFLMSGPASSDLTGKACSPYGIHWTYDTYALAHGTGGALVKQGGDSWFFITADYAFGHALERDTGDAVKAAGGKVLGSVNAPLNTQDFSSFLLQAQASKAKVIGLANAGGDTINSIKQASEFGIVTGGQKLAGLLVFLSDIHSIGLKTAQGLTITSAWYWAVSYTHLMVMCSRPAKLAIGPPMPKAKVMMPICSIDE